MIKRIMVLDTETTGSVPVDAPIEISVLTQPTGDDGKRDIRTWKLKPEFPITSGSASVHGILNEDTADFPSHDDALAELLAEKQKLLEDEETMVTGWNIEFDLKIINNAMIRHELPKIRFANVVDLMTVAKRVVDVSKCGGYSLNAVFVELSENKRKALDTLAASRANHSAENDVKITYDAYLLLLKRCGELGPSVTQGIKVTDATTFLEYSLRRIILDTWPIGKHKGRPFASVLLKDKKYVKWVLEQEWISEPRYDDFRYSIEILGKRCGFDADKMPF